jgi:hypothetical protein
MVQIDLNDVEATVTRTVVQTASVSIGEVLYSGSDVEDYVDYNGEWEDEDSDVDDVEYHLHGYVKQSEYNKLLQEKEELLKKVKALEARAPAKNETVKEEKA